MAISPDGAALAVTDARRGRVLFLCLADGSMRAISKKGQANSQLKLPCDVSYTPDGQQVVVADTYTKKVKIFNLDGTLACAFPVEGGVFALAVDGSGNICTAGENHIKVFSRQGMLLHDKLGGLPLRFHVKATPCLALDSSSGRIAVSVSADRTVFILDDR
jgi:DNA-binding beta-propeller fold protein YncE